MGSEMCIRNRVAGVDLLFFFGFELKILLTEIFFFLFLSSCLFYTSDAADDLPRLDPGGLLIF